MENVGDGIEVTQGFHFKSEAVARNFDEHVSKSVPEYDRMQEMAANLSDWFIRDGSTVVDYGAATGTTLQRMMTRHSTKKVRWLGYDSSEEMIAEAKKKGIDCITLRDLEDQTLMEFAKNDFSVALYTAQFLRPDYREIFFRKVYHSLTTEGAFFLVEKVRCEDGLIFDIVQNIYWEGKLKNGYSAEQVLSKAKSLRGVMHPLTVRSIDEKLHRAGFEQVELVFRNLFFCGWLAIKNR